jgi:hypothetical protein
METSITELTTLIVVSMEEFTRGIPRSFQFFTAAIKPNGTGVLFILH